MAKPLTIEPGAERTRLAAESQAWSLLGDLWFSQKPLLMEVCRDFDLFPPQIMVLRTLDRPKPMREVAGFLACNSSNLTGITDRLEERQLVQRTADPADRRIKLLVLTPEGQQVRREVLDRLGTPPAAMSDLSDEDVENLNRILITLSAS